jgi:hypothetical protein
MFQLRPPSAMGALGEMRRNLAGSLFAKPVVYKFKKF